MRGLSAIEQLRHYGCMTPDKPFVLQTIGSEQLTISYFDACNDVASTAKRILEAVPGGGVVLLFVLQGWTGMAYFFGAMAVGAVPSFMPLPSVKQNPESYWMSHIALLDRVRPAAVIVDPDFVDTFVETMNLATDIPVIPAVVPTELRPAHLDNIAASSRFDIDAMALLQHSSGTTGLKKGVTLSHRAIARQVAFYGRAINALASDVVVSWLPVYHDMGLIACLMGPLAFGQTIVLLDPLEWVARPASLFEAIMANRGTLCWMPNFAFDHLARLVRADPAKMALDGMRAFINCSEVCHASTFDRFRAAFTPLGVTDAMLQTCYAMAEATFAVTQTSLGKPATTVLADAAALREAGRLEGPGGREAIVLLSSGQPIRGVNISVRDPDGAELPDGTVGEVWVRSISLFSGYYKQPKESEDRIAGECFRTRDRGFIHEGELFVLGRLDDLLIVAGRNVHAAEIEAIVAGVPGLRPGRAVAFDVRNESRGTNDLIVIAEEAEPLGELPLTRLIRQAVFDGIGFYPARVLLVNRGWLHKTTSGKLSRHANRDRYLAMPSVSQCT